MIETIVISVIALAWVPAVVLGARYMATGHLWAARSLRVRALGELVSDFPIESEQEIIAAIEAAGERAIPR